MDRSEGSDELSLFMASPPVLRLPSVAFFFFFFDFSVLRNTRSSPRSKVCVRGDELPLDFKNAKVPSAGRISKRSGRS